MLEYFLRRLLLAIPTFLGSTLIVFFIVQLAPGGPLEQQIMALQMAAAGESGGTSVTSEGGVNIPPSALEELKRFYGFDQPIHIRYLIWLGVYPRELESFKLTPNVSRNIGGGERAIVKEEGGKIQVFDANTNTPLADWQIAETETDEAGNTTVRIFKKGYSGLFTGEFGKSFVYNEPVSELIKQRLNISLQFGLIGLIMTYTVCVYLGIRKALEHGTPFDLISSIVVFIAYSIPGWALGAMLLVALGGGSWLDIFPLGGLQSQNYETLNFWEKFLDRAYHAVLPTTAYVISSFATLTVLMKNSLLENLSQDYIRTAFAKGLHEKRVIWVHAMRNSIIPIAANIGGIIGVFLTGSYIIEKVFNINGIGLLSFQSILARDYAVVFAFTVINVIIRLLAAIISDFVLAIVDPRIRFQ